MLVASRVFHLTFADGEDYLSFPDSGFFYYEGHCWNSFLLALLMLGTGA